MTKTSPPADGDDHGPALDWDEAGAPRSRRFGDIYFSQQDGLAESRAVFLTGCGLPEAWAGRAHFTVGELGFGTGLNIAALLDLWRRERPPGGRLHIFSIEAYPISREEAARALAAWPEVAEAVDALLGQWPDQASGFRRVELPGFHATLDLAVCEVATALEQWDGAADAWFLDGFSPSTNPQMWRNEVLQLVARRSAPGARIATFTVAGAVRRGLQAQGFSVEKRPGHGRKRERLEVRAPGTPGHRPGPGRVVIIGAGVAGAALARSFSALGVRPLVIASERSGPFASGNPAALVSPRLDAGAGPIAHLCAQAYARARARYLQAADGVIATGALQLEASARDAGRFDAVASSPIFADCGLQRLTAEAASALLGEASQTGGLWMDRAPTVEPATVLDRWLAQSDVLEAQVDELRHEDGEWRVLDGSGALIAAADCLVLACGPANARFAGLDLEPIRGQVSFCAWPDRPAPAAWGGYLIPTRDGLLFGATHDRGDTDTAVRARDHQRNLTQLAGRRPELSAALDAGQLDGRAGVRASSPDRLPVAGAAPHMPGAFVLGGLGGRGFAFAPLLAEHIAALACGLASPLPREGQAVVDPDRFRLRQLRRASAG